MSVNFNAVFSSSQPEPAISKGGRSASLNCQRHVQLPTELSQEWVILVGKAECSCQLGCYRPGLGRTAQLPGEQHREVRRQALFWLANSEDEKSLAALMEILTRR
jgi:hypothetical protein